MIKLVIILLSAIAVMECQRPRSKPLQEFSRMPQRALGDQPPSVDWGTFLTDEKGRPKQRLMLSLDVMSPSVTGLPSCQIPLDERFELGRYHCVDPMAERYEPLLAGHVHQQCYTNPSDPGKAPRQILALRGCKSLAIRGYAFDPPLRVDAESREL